MATLWFFVFIVFVTAQYADDGTIAQKKKGGKGPMI